MLAKWIVFVGIEAGGDDDEFRFERVGRRHQHVLKDRVILVIALTSLHRHIDRKPFAGSAAPLRRSTRAGIVRILMGAEKENGWIVLETMLRAISVMHIPIDDEHALRPYFF